MKTYPHHPFADIFPFRDGPSLIELSDSIAEHGQYDEIVLFEKQVLEGRRRQAACIRAGVKPRYREFGSKKSDGKDALAFSFSVNFNRRSMSPGELVMAARNYATLRKGYNPNPTNVGLDEKPVSRKEAAEKFGVNEKQIERANKVMEKGVPELQDAVKAEKVSISDAASIADQPPEVQRQALASVASGATKTLAAAVAASGSPTPPPLPAIDARAIARGLKACEGPLARLDTKNEAGRKLACDTLRSLVDLVGRL